MTCVIIFKSVVCELGSNFKAGVSRAQSKKGQVCIYHKYQDCEGKQVCLSSKQVLKVLTSHMIEHMIIICATSWTLNYSDDKGQSACFHSQEWLIRKNSNEHKRGLLTCHWALLLPLLAVRWTAGKVCWSNAAVHWSDEPPRRSAPPWSQSHQGYRCAVGDSADPEPRCRLCCCLHNTTGHKQHGGKKWMLVPGWTDGK